MPATATKSDAMKSISALRPFISNQQQHCMLTGMQGEERQFFYDRAVGLAKIIAAMPKTGETDGKGDAAIVFLHYFKGGSDWWIIEKDMEQEQLQALGFACLNGDTQSAELGYISIEELKAHKVELDFFWRPISLAEVKKKHISAEALGIS